MAAENLTYWTYPIWFVTDEAGNYPGRGNVFGTTYESMRLGKFNVKLVTPQKCLKIRQREPKLFILDPFSGPVFEHLVSLGCRIMGPLFVYKHLRDGKRFPNLDYPVYSTAMKDVVLCCTKLGPSERSDIHEKVKFMYGTYSDDLTKDVTHLVCGEVGSKKYHVAASFRLPIVGPEWVEEIWNKCQHKLVHGSTLPYEYFRCPVFKGLTISVSQLSSDDRDFIKQIVEEEGGCYTASLDLDETTHLILLEPKGEKFKFAKEWKLFCVHEDWFYDSLEAGYCMDENLYPPKSIEASQTPEPETMDCKSVSQENMDCKNVSQESMGCKSVSQESMDCKSVLEENEDVQLNATSSTGFQSSIKKELPSLEKLTSFDISSLPESEDYLDACNFYVSDFNDCHMKKLCKIINAGGGSRFSMYTDAITHVICGKNNDQLIDLVKSSSNRPHVVSFDWLLECCKKEKLIDEAPFSCMGQCPVTPDHKVTVQSEVENVKRRQSSRNKSQKQDLNDLDDIVKQYLPN